MCLNWPYCDQAKNRTMLGFNSIYRIWAYIIVSKKKDYKFCKNVPKRYTLSAKSSLILGENMTVFRIEGHICSSLGTKSRSRGGHQNVIFVSDLIYS